MPKHVRTTHVTMAKRDTAVAGLKFCLIVAALLASVHVAQTLMADMDSPPKQEHAMAAAAAGA